MSKRIIFNVLHKITALILVLLWAGCGHMDTKQADARPDSMKSSFSSKRALGKTTPETTSLTEAQKQTVLDSYGKLPLYFIENQGQTDSRVEFYINQPGQNVFFTSQALYLRLSQDIDGDKKAHGLRIDLVNADPEGTIKSIKRSSAKINIFKGEKEEWKTDIPTSSEIAYTGPWPGVRLHYQGKQGRLESIFHVAPGVDPSVIRMRYSGQDRLLLDEKGNLIVETTVGRVIESAPYMYQEIDGRKVPVKGDFRLKGDFVSFSIASYNPEYTLIIDPTIIYAGYVGGSGAEGGYGIAVDSSGNAYITGYTASSEATFPVTVGPDLTFNGYSDAFVAKVNPGGTGLVYSGYIGGIGGDEGQSIAVDSSGNAYIIGKTWSDEATFPVTVGPDLTYNGNFDTFVVKVNSAGTALVYAGYIGGNSYEEGYGIAVDSSNNAYIAGRTESTEATFPVTVGPDLTHNGAVDAFVAKISPGGTSFVYSGYIGGSSTDYGNDIAVDGSGNAYITGETYSSETTFPVTVGPDLTYNGGDDAFIAKIACKILFSDVSGHWAVGYINAIHCADITTGFPDGTYKPENQVTRAQMAAFIIRALYGESFSYSSTPHFPDVSAGHWAFKYVQRLFEDGITTGFPDGTYGPDSVVTRAQMAAFLIRALYGESFTYSGTAYFPDVPASHWAFKYVQRLFEDGITTGFPDGTYGPDSIVTRAQMAALLSRTFLGMP